MLDGKKTVLITGCSADGIGAALATAFHDAGYHVFATARTTSKIPESVSSLPHVTVLQLDVVSSSSILAAAEKVSKFTGGELDVLVNNSGVMYTMPGLDIDIDEARKTFDVNFFGLIAVTKAFAPLLISAKGALVNNSSISGEKNAVYNSVYAATKAALTIAGETWRLELEPLNVRVVTLVTGLVDTKLIDNQGTVHLPPGSRYKAIAAGLANNDAVADDLAMPADRYAKIVVAKVKGGAKGKIFVGGLAPTFRWFTWWMPTWIYDRVIVNQFKSSGLFPPNLGKDE